MVGCNFEHFFFLNCLDPFKNMLDVADVAALVIWVSLNPVWSKNDRRGCRRQFLKQLG